MRNNFAPLRAQCAFGVRGELLCVTASFLYAHTASRCADCSFCVTSCRSARSNQEASGGFAPQPRAALPRPVRAFGGKLRFPRRREKIWAGSDSGILSTAVGQEGVGLVARCFASLVFATTPSAFSAVRAEGDLSLCRLRKRFSTNSPIFDMSVASLPKVGHRTPAQLVLEAVPNKTGHLHLPKPLSVASSATRTVRRYAARG